MKPNKEKIDKLIVEMAHFDPDNMEMGAKALTELILTGQLNLDEDEQTSNAIREAYMKQMESENYNVHAHAIKCMAEIISKLPSRQVEIIFERILTFISNPTLEEKKRERYGVCAGTVIHQASEEYGVKLVNLFVESIKKLLEVKDQKTEIEVILINIISEFIKKWPAISANPHKLSYDKKGLILYLLKNVQIKSKLEIIKKSELCLGKIALISQKDMLEVLLTNPDYGLLNFIALNASKLKIENIKHLRNGILCLSQILRTHNSEIRHWAKTIAELLVKIIEQYSQNQQLDHIDFTCDILDACLVSLSYCLKSYSRDLGSLLENEHHPLSSFVGDLINYNLEGMMCYAGEPMAVEGEEENTDAYYEEAEADEKCWKVRRATIHYITFLSKKDKYFRETMNKYGEFIEVLGMKLIEENAMVSEMAFEAFNNLIDSISMERQTHDGEIEDFEEMSLQRIKSSEHEIAKKIISEINNRMKIIFSNPKFNDQLRIQASKILLRIIQFYRDELSSLHELTSQLIFNIVEEAKKTTVIESKNNLLLALKALIFDNIDFSHYTEAFKTFIKFSTASQIKIQSTAFQGIRAFFKVFSREVFREKQFTVILQTIKKKLKEHDSDKIVKISVIKCAGSIIASDFDQNYVGDIQELLESIADKIKIEIEKTYIFEQVSKINCKIVKFEKLVKTLQRLLDLSSESLGSANFELNQKAVQATTKLVEMLGSSVGGETAKELLQKSKVLIQELKTPAFVQILMERHAGLFAQYAEMIIKSTDCNLILSLLKYKIVDVGKCIAILQAVSQEKSESYRRISTILGRIGVQESELLKNVNETQWGKICVGALGYVGNLNTAEFLFKVISKEKNDDLRFEAASALGNIASRNTGLIENIVKCADSTQDEYIYIYAIKEMLIFAEASLIDFNFLINWLFKKAENQYEGESIYYIISECIGKICLASEQIASLILLNSTSTNDNRRMVVANSLRFALETHVTVDSEHFQNYIKAVIELMTDKKVQIREGATKSLSSIAIYCHHVIKKYKGEAFWKIIKHNLAVDKNLIVVIDYGISKEKKDLGKGLRLETFSLLQILLKQWSIESHLIEELISSVLDQINEESSPDNLLKRLAIIKTLCQLDYTQFIRFQQDFIRKVGFKEGILKHYLKKEIAQDERSQIYVKTIFKEISEINSFAKEENIEQIGNLIGQIKGLSEFSKLMEEVESGRND